MVSHGNLSVATNARMMSGWPIVGHSEVEKSLISNSVCELCARFRGYSGRKNGQSDLRPISRLSSNRPTNPARGSRQCARTVPFLRAKRRKSLRLDPPVRVLFIFKVDFSRVLGHTEPTTAIRTRIPAHRSGHRTVASLMGDLRRTQKWRCYKGRGRVFEKP